MNEILLNERDSFEWKSHFDRMRCFWMRRYFKRTGHFGWISSFGRTRHFWEEIFWVKRTISERTSFYWEKACDTFRPPYFGLWLFHPRFLGDSIYQISISISFFIDYYSILLMDHNECATAVVLGASLSLRSFLEMFRTLREVRRVSIRRTPYLAVYTLFFL